MNIYTARRAFDLASCGTRLQVPLALFRLSMQIEWFKSCVGTATEDRAMSLRPYDSLRKNLVINDTLKDARFADNPQVINPPHIRFYAGVTLHDHATHCQSAPFALKIRIRAN
jgi:GAF domain-containing protein